MTKFQKAIMLIIAFVPFLIVGIVFAAANPQLGLACMLWAVAIVFLTIAYILLGGQQIVNATMYHQYRVSAQPVRETPVSLVKEAIEDSYELSMVGYPRE